MEQNPSPPNETPPSSRVALFDLLVEMKQRDKLFQEYIETRSRIHNRWIVLIGIVAVIAGLWMAQLIHQMMDDMAIMSTKMVAMEGYMQNMEGAMVPMRGYMKTMSGDMSAMRDDIASVPQMQRNVGQMASSVNRMQYDTGVMRHGVANMSHDMGSMSHPFYMLNSVTPW
jgi:hypothetical protein